MGFLNGIVQVFLGPPGVSAPDNLEDGIVEFIDSADHTLDIAVEELDDPKIAAAIDRAARRKRPGSDKLLRLRYITEGDYLVEEKPVEPPSKTVSLDTNREHFMTLSRSGKLHHKVLVLDGKVVIDGSFNFTGPANEYNDENLFIIRDAAIASHFEAEVERVFGDVALSADFL